MQENYCKYISAKPQTKQQSAQLTSSNSIVGNAFECKIDKKTRQVIIHNKFDYPVATIDNTDAENIILQINKGHAVKALLAYITYNADASSHSANFLIIAYPKSKSQAYENFCNYLSSQLKNGNRPDIKIDKFEDDKIINSNGAWRPNKMLKQIKLEPGTVIIKGKQSFIEKIIEAGRNKNPGCYIGSILFIIAVIGMILWPISMLIFG